MADPITSRFENSKIDISKVETLTQIWQRIFRRSPIRPDEDFFDLGGDAWLSAELFTEINHNFSINFPPATICSASTIAALAAALDHPRPEGPAILLKRGSTQAPPIFIFHGIGSSVVEMVPLVRRMQVDQPIYGLESRGNDGREQPQGRIEEMAQLFLAAIREIQPHGPYFLIGYSFGGLVALELAQQLKAAAEEVGLLVMLDSYPDRHYLSFGQYSRLLLQLARNRLTGRAHSAVARRSRLGQTADSRTSLVHALQRVKDAHYRALHSYRPRSYDGDVKFIRAAIPSDFPADPVPVWSHLIRRLDVETVPGKHVSMLSAGADPIQSLLDKYVREADARHVRRAP